MAHAIFISPQQPCQLCHRSSTSKSKSPLIQILPTINHWQDVQFTFNAQHDCISAGCTASGTRAVMQEREESARREHVIEHQHPHDEKFVINLCSLHNPHLLRQILPRSLVAPIPLYPDRQTKHIEQARRLREINSKKREENKRKREAQATGSRSKAHQSQSRTSARTTRAAQSRTSRPSRTSTTHRVMARSGLRTIVSLDSDDEPDSNYSGSDCDSSEPEGADNSQSYNLDADVQESDNESNDDSADDSDSPSLSHSHKRRRLH